MKKLLKKENLKIEELLEEESISDEINNEKSAIHKFLTPENLKIILNYLMVDQNKEDQKKAYKFPKVAESVLSCKAPSILQFFQTENSNKKLSHFEQLFSFVINPKQESILSEEINFTRASYVKTVVVSLLVNQPQTFSTYLFNQELILDALLAHAYSRSIQFILKSLLQAPHKEDENPNEIDQNVERESVTVWITEIQKNKINLLEKILQILLTTSDNSQAVFQSNNLTQVFLTYMKASYGGLEKVSSLKKEYLQSISEHFFDGINKKRARNLGELFMEFTSTQSEEDQKNRLDFFEKLLKVQQILTEGNQKKTSTIGRSQLKIPSNLVYTAGLVNDIFIKNIDNKKFCEKFNEGYISFLFSLFEKYPLNNVLHDKLTILLIKISESDDKVLFKKFFTNENFLNLKKNLMEETKVKHHTFYCFITKLIRSLEQSQFAEILYKDENHKNFLQNFYFPKIEQEDKSLGGVEPNNSAPHADFYYSIEEIEIKYKKFLEGENIGQSSADTKQQRMKNQTDENEKNEEEDEDISDKMIPQQVQKNLIQEIKQINESNEDLHFGDQMFWKPTVTTDIDSLMNELLQKIQFFNETLQK